MTSGIDPVPSNEEYQLVELEAGAIPAIVELENACWLPEIRATAQTLEQRFAMGHICLGMQSNNVLAGIVSFSYSRFSPDNAANLPTTFQEFSRRPMDDNYNTAFAYNLNIHPDARGGTLTRELLTAGLQRMRKDACRYLLGVSRCPSYNGSSNGEIEDIPHSSVLRNAIDEFMRSGQQPTRAQLLADPVLKFYWYSLECEFLRIAPGFLPNDAPSGGFGIVFYKTL